MLDYIKRHAVSVLLAAGIAAGCILCFLGGSDKTENVALTDEEQKIVSIVESIEGVSCAKVLISYSNAVPAQAFTGQYTEGVSVTGIAVTACGADIAKNKYRIINLLSTAYSLPTNRIFVCGSG